LALNGCCPWSALPGTAKAVNLLELPAQPAFVSMRRTRNASIFNSIEEKPHMVNRGMSCKAKWFMAGAVLTSLAFAGATMSASAAGQQKNTAATANPNAQMIMQLKTFRTALQNANHDYEGHRAKAVHEITKAIHALEGTAVPKAKKNAGTKGAANKGNNEPQSVSDAQLQQVLKGLQTMQSQIGSNPTGTVAEVNTLISVAITELETALKVK
jgi:hypothetical protein